MSTFNYLKAFLATFLLVLSFDVSAQQLFIISGRVTDEATGEPLTGALVSVKGSTLGAVTDLNGRYTISVTPENAVLVFSFLGYETTEITVGTRRAIDVAMRVSALHINEVVVTALGITRETKSLGYSVQEVDGDLLTESHEVNLLNTLSGRIAGVQITNASGGIGASSNIQIRGQNFVSGYNYNNSPLFVVDGVPISNRNEQTTRSFTGRQDFNRPNYMGGSGGGGGENEAEIDFGNGAAEIDPNDIESMTVLKGPTAAALYGSRASNGVILITTKSGKGTRGIGVTLSTYFGMETPLKLPDYQYVYGQGSNGEYRYVDGKGGGLNDNTMGNWGPRMDGRLIAQWDSPVDPVTGERVPTPFVAQPDQLKDFFQTGHTNTNNVSIQGSDNKLNFRLSFTNSNQTGIVPNTDLQRNTIGLNAGYAILPELKVDANINYTNTASDNRASYGAKNNDAIMRIFMYMPRNVDVKKLRDYWKEGSGDLIQNSPIWSENGNRLNNPWFVAYENLNGNNRDRIYGHIKLTYDIRPDLQLMLRSGRDVYNDKRTIRRAVSASQSIDGHYQVDDIAFLETNHDFLLSYKPETTGDFTISASAGGNLMKQTQTRLGSVVTRLSIPHVYSITNNAVPVTSGSEYWEKRINSLYGMAQIGYMNAVFLDLTGRGDWSSALPVKNNSYFYPSASLSVVLSDLLHFSGTEFLKVRASVASVRRDLEPYQTATNFQISQGWGGETVAVANNNYPNADIRPEKVLSYEIGADARFFGNRVALDMTWYKSITTDLIIPVTLNPSAGYDTKLMNVGKMSNWGIEAMLNVVPVRSDTFEWKVNINFGLNRNKVHYLDEAHGVSRIRQLERWASLELRTENTKGDGSFGSLYGDYLIYDEQGRLTHRNGRPQEENGDWGYLGNVNPKWTGSISNQFTYKGMTFSFLFDGRKGGVVHSRTFLDGVASGAFKESLAGRDNDGGGTMVGEGVDLDTGQANAVEVPVQTYWGSYYGNDRIATFDASYIKLREVKLTYALPAKILSKTPIKGASVSVTGRNLLLWSDVPYIDPEVSSYDGQFQGVESFSLPSLRSFGVSLNISF